MKDFNSYEYSHYIHVIEKCYTYTKMRGWVHRGKGIYFNNDFDDNRENFMEDMP